MDSCVKIMEIIPVVSTHLELECFADILIVVTVIITWAVVSILHAACKWWHHHFSANNDCNLGKQTQQRALQWRFQLLPQSQTSSIVSDEPRVSHYLQSYTGYLECLVSVDTQQTPAFSSWVSPKSPGFNGMVPFLVYFDCKWETRDLNSSKESDVS